MCTYKILAQHTDGYVVSCQSCKAIQFAFGTTLVKMLPEDFQELKERVRLEGLCHQEAQLHLKSIILPVSETAMLCLTYKELQKLEHLLQEAGAMLETYKILDYI